jgi:hypothetical protein
VSSRSGLLRTRLKDPRGTQRAQSQTEVRLRTPLVRVRRFPRRNYVSYTKGAEQHTGDERPTVPSGHVLDDGCGELSPMSSGSSVK